MPDRIRPWQADESLCELALYADWDLVASMILSLRLHLFEHGTIPVWNFMFCGGRPELAIPHSWAYTWPSLFAYALPPNAAILALWVALSLLGFLSMRALLLRWSGSALGAHTGAALWVFSGYFAARFNGGHLSFAFSHFVPLLLYLFDLAYQRGLAGDKVLVPCLLSWLAAFLFASAALPHPLLHAYPAFLLLVALLVVRAAGREGLRPSLRAAVPPGAAHLLGMGLAAYKLWPVIRWQLDHPRPGVLFESYAVSEVILNTLLLAPDFLESGVRHQPWHLYPPWGYDAFVGPVPWLVAGSALAILLVRRRCGAGDPKSRAKRAAALFGLLLVAAGVALALGNDHPYAPGSLFRHLPVLSGVRAFNRYQVLIVLGLSILVGLGLPIVVGLLPGPGARRTVAAILALSIVGPVLVQSSLLVWNVLAEPRERIRERYGLPERRGPPVQVASIRRGGLRRTFHETSLLEHGYWIAGCHTNLALPGRWPESGPRHLAPLSFPPPLRLEELGAAHIALSYRGAAGDVRLNLRLLDGFELHTAGKTLSLTARYPGPRQGAIASALALGAGVGFFALLRRKEARRSRRGR